MPTNSLEPDFGISNTFSIVAADPATGICGAAVASKYPDVGHVVPYVRAGVGAFCTQHWHNPPWGEKALDGLAAGKTPEEVLAELLSNDSKKDQRQLALINIHGQIAIHQPTGADAKSEYWGGMTGKFYSCQGNTLTGHEVIEKMAQAYEKTDGSLAEKLMAALLAGDRAGGDHRGRLAAAIVVCKPGVTNHWIELYTDKSDSAVEELAAKFRKLEHAEASQ